MQIDRDQWETVTLGDVVKEISDHERDPEERGIERYVGLDHLDPGDLRIRRWGLISDGVTFTKAFHAGQVLFGKRRVYQKKVGVPDFDGLCSGDIIVLEVKDRRMLPEFLPYVTASDAFFAHAEKTSRGSLSPRTKFRDLSRFEFLLPPLEQQREIVELMHGFEAAIEASKATLIDLSVLEDVLLKRISSLTEKPSEISDLASHITSGPRGWAQYYNSTGSMFIRIGDMRRSHLYPSFEEVQYIDVPLSQEAERTRLQTNDILISITADIGIVNLYERREVDAYVNQHIAIVRIAGANAKYCA